jgi:hypothetical protein
MDATFSQRSIIGATDSRQGLVLNTAAIVNDAPRETRRETSGDSTAGQEPAR